MARGWESKSVEAQIEEAESEPSANTYQSLSAAQMQTRIKKDDLILSRKRILQQMEQSSSERYTDLLRRTLADLDVQLATLG